MIDGALTALLIVTVVIALVGGFTLLGKAFERFVRDENGER